jgi:flagellar assembly protein FliH
MSKVLKFAKFEPKEKVHVTGHQFGVPEEVNDPEDTPVIPQPESYTDKANVILANAQAEARTILQQAQIQAVQSEEQAQEEGWQLGYAEGKKAAETEMAEEIAAIRHLAEGAVAGSNKFMQDNQSEVGKLAIAIAKKLTTQALTLNPEIVSDTVARIIEAVNIQGACRIRINPQDYEILKPHWDAVANLQEPANRWELVADKNTTRGGFFIEVGGGTIDARLETRLAQIEASLAELSE